MLGAHPGPGPGAPALDPGPAPHCGGTEGRRDGGREGGKDRRRRLPRKEVWRAAQGDPDMEAAAGMQPPRPRPRRPPHPPRPHQRRPWTSARAGPRDPLPEPGPEPRIPASPARGAPRIPALRGAPAPPAAQFPLPRMLTPSLPSPTARPSRSSQNPRPLAAPARPPPHRRPGRGGGAGPRAPASRAPLFPVAVPGPPGHPPGTQASPTHGSGVWGRPEGRIQPQGT